METIENGHTLFTDTENFGTSFLWRTDRRRYVADIILAMLFGWGQIILAHWFEYLLQRKLLLVDSDKGSREKLCGGFREWFNNDEPLLTDGSGEDIAGED